jgi:hypothetical protein
MTSFPTLAPTSRNYSGGDWPVKNYKAQDGYEFRFLYGDKRSGHEVSLTYSNIPDAVAEQFMQHYYEQKGTFSTFALPANESIAKGWGSTPTFFNAGVGAKYRYAEPPKLDSVRPGVSSVQVRLVGVLVGGG